MESHLPRGSATVRIDPVTQTDWQTQGGIPAVRDHIRADEYAF